VNRRHLPVRVLAILSVAVALLPSREARAVEPGVDVAVPRVTLSLIGAAFAFVPANPVVEQGDFVRWRNVGSGIHTSTSGPGCGVVDGQWDFSLGPGIQTPALPFGQPPGGIPYHCTPHCGLGMAGTVTVTDLIDVKATHGAGILMLSWTGGSGHYQVFRSDNALFNPPNTQTLNPDGGFDSGTTFTDSTSQPATGKAFFYLVMNKTLS